MTMTRREEIESIVERHVHGHLSQGEIFIHGASEAAEEIATILALPPVETGELVKRLNDYAFGLEYDGNGNAKTIRAAASALTQQEAEIARLREDVAECDRASRQAEGLAWEVSAEKAEVEAERDELQRKLDEALDLLVAVDSEFFLPGGLKDAVDAALSQKDEGQ